jgi:hypothetical protein
MCIETDHDRRPILKTFIGRPRPKSLVFPTKDDLFEVENEIVDRFARIAPRTSIHILCLDDSDHPLSAALVRNAGDKLPSLLMDNAISFHHPIENRFAQLDIDERGGTRSQQLPHSGKQRFCLLSIRRC